MQANRRPSGAFSGPGLRTHGEPASADSPRSGSGRAFSLSGLSPAAVCTAGGSLASKRMLLFTLLQVAWVSARPALPPTSRVFLPGVRLRTGFPLRGWENLQRLCGTLSAMALLGGSHSFCC